jgi:flagellar hook-associated protein 1 FlgK
MSSIYDILNIGKLGMMAQQAAVQVTAHNIANVNTEGYSRQEVIFEEGIPLNSSPGQTGTGVNAAAIQRRYDSFIEGQLTDSKETLGNLDVQRSALSKIEGLFYDSMGTGINELLGQFFNSMQDLSANPAGTPERVTVLSRADALTDAINNIYSNLEQLQKDMNSQVSQTVNEINSITSRIASLNADIRQAEITGQNANDYRDMRGRLINDLAEKIDIQYFEDDTGQVTVIGGGIATLVEKGNSWTLDTEINTEINTDNYDYYDYYNIIYSPDDSNVINLTDRVSNGRLKGLLTIRDTETSDAMDELDRLAAAIASGINQVHRTGYGLDGSTGKNLFTPSFDTGDVLFVEDVGDVGAITALSTNTGTGSVGATIDDPSALTFNDYELTFSGGNYTFLNKSTNASITEAYADPSTFTFEGLSVNISGSFDEGDTYIISAHKNTAKNLQVAIDMSDTARIAAATASTDNRGDNRNVLALVQIQDALTIDGTSSFGSYYGSIVGRIGVNSQYINNQYSAQEFSSEQLHNMRESVSGVSIDEEMTNLMKFQNAYQASARLITIGDELLEILIGLVR